MSFKFPERMPTAGASDDAGLAAVVEAAGGVLVVAADGRMLYVNSALESMFGYSKAQLLGQKVEMLLPAEIRERHLDFRQLFCPAHAKNHGQRGVVRPACGWTPVSD